MSSLPDLSPQFIESLSSLSGVDVKALTEALDTPPAIGVRLNSRKPFAGSPCLYEGMSRVKWSRNGYYLSERPNFTLNPLLHAGAFYVQDPSSMVYGEAVRRIAEVIDSTAPLTVLDFCAAPGGKTTAMIDALPDGTCVVANEFSPIRGKILRENLEKWGYPSVITTGSDSKEYAGLPPLFDIIAVDAPCSGEGMMRKDAEARTQWSRNLVENCASLQRSILDDIVPLLRPGGYLLYSTCTFNLEEDERNARYIAERFGLESVDPYSLGIKGISRDEPVGISGTPASSLLPDEVFALRFMPHITAGEGIFLSIFHLPADGDCPATYLTMGAAPDLKRPGKVVKSKKKEKNKEKSGDLGKEVSAELSSWFIKEYDMRFQCNGSLVTALPAAMLPLLEILNGSGVHVTGAGLPVGELKGRIVVPDSRAALSSALHKEAFTTVDLDLGQALSFLRRESFPLGANIPQGYVVVTYKDVPLGMMKNLGSRANNLLPQAWRIRNC